ncbi:ATP-dependent helicase HrpB [Pseudooceanicola antarcticus]|uniref:ATP-dependent helicase HrpB n=1 Tax=Pseudooceanicola antarcticus TaxID=1247613 RepID=A0A285IKM2_9RHOB|nr:ATP-dependent helicase HrpB [Pseudooceanicola antarcticus]PJE28927.1 ATP-dependent helicase HrpB [Pseudooceanicola antarcticus]SNY47656.1 ATP-dependent helicase HrpB [Pseudooceanicola antarcticus]
MSASNLRLPIDDALPELIAALRASGRAVLQAPPGAGKTTRVPLAMLDAGLTPDRILMLEPRRLAARAAAERMAQTLGERAGETVGYRVRGEAKVGKATRIEVVTEGILTRMIQSDPELSGVGAVIFDEFHERSLNADLGLALCLEIAGALREDLILVAMSATLDAAPVAELMGGAPVVTSEGRAFPVELTHADKPLRKGRDLWPDLAALVTRAVEETEAGVLVFLPGAGEINRLAGLLEGRVPKHCHIRPLYGAMKFADQRAALEPAASGRNIVLATSIAETSLTIPDVRAVVDAGLSRRARFDPGAGMSRLVTEKVSRAEADQRAGRAGRVAPGRCYRAWTKGEEGALPAYPPAEIEAADLSGLVLELALWGAGPDQLAFLTPPPEGAYAEARALLRLLGALDDHGITEHGRKLAGLPLHPRLAHMLALAGPSAAPLAALLADRDPMARGAPVDLTLRLRALAGEREARADAGALARIRTEARRLARQAGPEAHLSPAEMAALAYPDRIGLRRPGEAPRFLLSGGKGAVLPSEDPLAGARLIVAMDLDGDPREAKIRQAAQIGEGELRALFPERIETCHICEWSRRDRRVLAREQERLGAIALSDRAWKDVDPQMQAEAMLEGVRELGLFPSKAAELFLARARMMGEDFPDFSEAALMDSLEEWLLPHLTGVRSQDDWKRFDLLPALRGRLSWDEGQMLDREVPAQFTTPLGRKIAIDYSGEDPAIALRLQEMFGQTRHPTVAGRPLVVTLLSPAGRPVQVTRDIPGFWTNSYPDVRKDMRGRYPRHPWPEDPREADPTLRAKRRS